MIAIIGAGLAGLGLAYTLLKSGFPASELQIFEAEYPGAGASGLPVALMHPTPGRTLFPKPGYADCFAYSQIWLQLLSQQSESPFVQPLRLLRPAFDDATASRFARSYARLKGAFEDNIFCLEPALRQSYLPDYRLPESTYVVEPAWRVEMPSLINTLKRELLSQGVLLLPQRLLSLESELGGWRLLTEKASAHFAQVVLAVAAELPKWLPALPIERIRGEVLVLKHAAFSRFSAAVSSGGYLLPLGGERALAGPTFYAADSPPRSTEWSVAEIRKSLQNCVPIVAEAEVETIWSGVRTLVKHDREPLVGAVPGAPGLFVFSAFATKGLLQIPWLAQALSAVLQGQNSAIPKYFSTSRFASEFWLRP
jgi:glycine oxidase